MKLVPGRQPELLWKTDSEFRLTQFEGASQEIFGLSPSRAIGRTLWDITGLDCQTSKWSKIIKYHKTHRSYDGITLGFFGADGSLRRIRVSGQPRFGKTGRLLGYHGRLIDVTEQENLQLEMDDVLIRTQAIAEIAGLATAGVTAEQLSEAAGRTFATILGAQLACFFRYYRERGELRLLGGHGLPPGEPCPLALPLEKVAPFAEATGSARPVTFGAGEADFLPGLAASRLPGAVMAIANKSGPAGLVCIYLDGGKPSDADLEFLQLFAAVLGPVSNYRRAEMRLKLYEEALNTIDRGVFVSESDIADAPPVFVNKAFARMTGYHAQDLSGPGGSPVGEAEQATRLQGGTTVRVDGVTGDLVHLRRRDGSLFWTDLSTVTKDADDAQFGGRIVVLSDVDERVALLEQIHAIEKVGLIGQLAGGMAHDFNNLLTVVIGNAENLVDEVGTQKLRNSAILILESAERCAAMTRRLLDFGRKRHLVPEAIVLNDVLETAGAFLRQALGPKIEMDISVEGGEQVLADRGLLESAILNLAMNARDAMPEGGKLTISARVAGPGLQTQPQSVEACRYIEIAVSDSGHGIPEEIRSRVLEPFFTTKARGQGSGIGLPLVHAFARLFGGYIEIESAPDKGTTVRLFLKRVMPVRLPRRVSGRKRMPAAAPPLQEA